MDPVELDRHHELADFLRNRRARLSPEQVGLPRGTRRRTPGLRRGEVAQLAGVSPEWYTWLEQGRDINVSVQLLESLARALQLDASERDHLFLLALKQPPPVETYAAPTIGPALQQFIDQLLMPAVIIDARMNVMAWNAAHSVVFGDYDLSSERSRNLMWRSFAFPSGYKGEQWEGLLRAYVAQFRAEYGRFINDPWWTGLIAELNQVSPKFRELWARHDVFNVSEGHKTIHNSLVGELVFDFLFFQAGDSSDLRVMVHTPRNGSGTAEKVRRLLDLKGQAYGPVGELSASAQRE